MKINVERSRLPNIAPYCSVIAENWTDSRSGEVLFTGDGTTTNFSGKVDLPPVNPLDSFTLHYTVGGNSYSVTANSEGNLSDGNMSGTITQDGTYNFTFNTPPDNGTDGTADYDYGIPPANLENALDPNNPNPSSLGWTSTIGAANFGQVRIYLPEPGVYLFGATVGKWSKNGAITYVKLIVTDPWSDTMINEGRVTVTTEQKLPLVSRICFIDSTTRTILLRFYTTGADEFFVKFYDVRIYKLN